MSTENIQENIIQKLFASFEDLEKAISSAKNTLSTRDHVPVDILKRINSYDSILLKQKSLANSLCEHITNGNWDEVSRHVGLINGLSGMIRDDARAILQALSYNPNPKTEDCDTDDTKYC